MCSRRLQCIFRGDRSGRSGRYWRRKQTFPNDARSVASVRLISGVLVVVRGISKSYLIIMTAAAAMAIAGIINSAALAVRITVAIADSNEQSIRIVVACVMRRAAKRWSLQQWGLAAITAMASLRADGHRYAPVRMLPL